MDIGSVSLQFHQNLASVGKVHDSQNTGDKIRFGSVSNHCVSGVRIMSLSR